MVPVSNTAAAVKKILDEKIGYGAAIASFQAAIDFDMKVLAANIEDSKWNTTRFLVVASKARRPSGTAACKSSVVFSTRNIPGALYQCLGAFARRGIDLYKIESRPVQIRGSSFGYVFYLDFAGDIRGSVQRNAIRELNGITTFFRFLGSYAVDHARDPQYRHKKKITN
jgi:prephenate dehydratase